MDKSLSGVNFLMGVVIGSFAGAAVALLMAPQSGFKTRKILKAKLNDVMDEGMDKMTKFKEEKIEPNIEKMSEQLMDSAKNVKSSLMTKLK